MHRCVVRASAASGGDAVGNEQVRVGIMKLHESGSPGLEWTGRLAAAMAWPWRFSFSSGNVEADALGHFGELGLAAPRVATGKNQVAAFAGHHAAQHQQVADLVEIGVSGRCCSRNRRRWFRRSCGARASPAATSFCTCSSLTGSGISAGRSMPAGASSRPTACCEKYCAPTPRSPDHSSTGRVLAVIHGHESQFVQPAR